MAIAPKQQGFGLGFGGIGAGRHAAKAPGACSGGRGGHGRSWLYPRRMETTAPPEPGVRQKPSTLAGSRREEADKLVRVERDALPRLLLLTAQGEPRMGRCTGLPRFQALPIPGVSSCWAC